jgi:hypothetical protein
MSHHCPFAPSLHDQIPTAANIGIYTAQEESECMVCSEPLKADQTVTILKHCQPRSHFFHNFCVWGLVYNRGIHTGPAYVPSCPMCSRRFHSLGIVHIGIPDRRKLKERISS